jgi:hypothetical protein
LSKKRSKKCSKSAIHQGSNPSLRESKRKFEIMIPPAFVPLWRLWCLRRLRPLLLQNRNSKTTIQTHNVDLAFLAAFSAVPEYRGPPKTKRGQKPRIVVATADGTVSSSRSLHASMKIFDNLPSPLKKGTWRKTGLDKSPMIGPNFRRLGIQKSKSFSYRILFFSLLSPNWPPRRQFYSCCHTVTL